MRITVKGLWIVLFFTVSELWFALRLYIVYHKKEVLSRNFHLTYYRRCNIMYYVECVMWDVKC
ncbi:MAG: hypothetical protein U9R01_05120, partial [candidate division WOR-3 bacterium]|nr:hypothetical protein [candidate division WOR-3 bacterium]